MRPSAGFDADQAGRQFRKTRPHLSCRRKATRPSDETLWIENQFREGDADGDNLFMDGAFNGSFLAQRSQAFNGPTIPRMLCGSGSVRKISLHHQRTIFPSCLTSSQALM